MDPTTLEHLLPDEHGWINELLAVVDGGEVWFVEMWSRIAALRAERDALRARVAGLEGAAREMVKVVEEWPAHPDGDYLHGWPLNQLRAALAPAPRPEER